MREIGRLVDRYNDFLFDGGKLWPKVSTDLNLLLKQKGIVRMIVIGLLANTCIETTTCFAAELGYHVTLVKKATAALRFPLHVFETIL